MRRTLLALALIFAVPDRLLAQASLLVSGYTSQAIHRYDASGAPLGTVAAAAGAQSLRYGPDGFLYACAEEEDRVLRLDGTTGAFVANFVWDDPATPADESGGLDAPTAAVFGPDGALYVASFSQDRVLRYDGGTGAFLDAFATLADGLSRPRMLRFRGDGTLWVTSWGNNRLLRFGLDGNLLNTVALGVVRPTGLVIDPASGDLLVTSDQESDVRAFDGITGAAQGTLVAAGAGGLVGGTYLEYLPERDLVFERLVPGIAGSSSAVDLRGGTPNELAYLLYGLGAQSQKVGPCQTWIGVQIAGAVPAPLDAAGRFHLDVPLPLGLAGVPLFVQAVEPATCRASNLVIQTVN